MESNEDYKQGIRLLRIHCHKRNINFRKYPWLIDLSFILSKYNSCYKFWKGVIDQKLLKNIPKCKVIYDVFFKRDTVIMHWDDTEEGYYYWSGLFKSIFYKDENIFSLEKISLTEMRYIKIGNNI